MEKRFTAPLDELDRDVERMERELEDLRRRREARAADLWSSYKEGYERYLHGDPAPKNDEPELEQSEADATETDEDQAP